MTRKPGRQSTATVHISRDVVRRAKVVSAETGETIQEIATKALLQYLPKLELELENSWGDEMLAEIRRDQNER
jgi:hypothetical protein